jgi:hypothetical protein
MAVFGTRKEDYGEFNGQVRELFGNITLCRGLESQLSRVRQIWLIGLGIRSCKGLVLSLHSRDHRRTGNCVRR